MPKIGPLELVIILVVVLMVFGIGKLPQIGSAIGKSLRAFRTSQDGDNVEEEPQKTSKTKKSKAAKKEAVAQLTAEDKTQSA